MIDIAIDTTRTIAVKNVDNASEIFMGGRPRRIPRGAMRCILMLLGLLGFGTALLLFYVYWNETLSVTLLRTAMDDVATAKELSMDGNDTLAARLEREVRILCWVMTTPSRHKTKAIHVLNTWGKRCTRIYFVTSQPDDKLPTIVVEKLDNYEFLWGKTKAAFKYIYEHLRDEADWFMKADDDTYTFVENMRYMLYPYSPDWPIYFGFKFKLFTQEEKNAAYMSGGSGYVLSREALRRFVVDGLTNATKCRQEDDSAEDVEVGNCLYNVGVLAGDSRCEKLKERFQPFAPFTTLISGYNGMEFWYYTKSFYSPRSCMECLSEYPVAFHYIDASELYVYEYFNYEFEAYGLPQYPEQLPSKLLYNELIIPPSDNIY